MKAETQNVAVHSPLPWQVAHSPKFGDPFISTAQNYMVAGSVHGISPEIAEANAALIVRAVNNHQALVDALKDCVSSMQSMWAIVAPNGSKNETLESARTLLASLQ